MSDRNSLEELESGYEGVAEYYDLFADNSDIPFFTEYANRMGSPILDLAAGTGRVTFALANEGFEVVALEKSKSMLSVARRKLDQSPTEVARRVKIIEGTMKNFALDRKFSLIIVPNSFGHLLTSQDQLSALSSIKNHLKDDGIFILDLYPGALQYEQATFEDSPQRMSNGNIVRRIGEIKSDFPKQLMRLELCYLVQDDEGHVIKETKVVSGAALIFNREADLLIRISGLNVEDEFGDFEKHPYTHDSGRRIFILRK
ncbi:MAG: class I SAM-dependent methyltransferase [Candidatus Thorarchaeota archaeon]